MKKLLCFSLLLSLLLGCSTIREAEQEELALLAEYNYSNYSISVYNGAFIPTKSDDAVFFTLSSDLPGTYDFIAENILLENGCIIQNHYLDNGRTLATLLLDKDGKPIDLIRKDFVLPETKSGDLWDCIEEAYEEIEEYIEDHMALNAICNSFSSICELIKIYVSYLDCCFNGEIEP